MASVMKIEGTRKARARKLRAAVPPEVGANAEATRDLERLVNRAAELSREYRRLDRAALDVVHFDRAEYVRLASEREHVKTELGVLETQLPQEVRRQFAHLLNPSMMGEYTHKGGASHRQRSLTGRPPKGPSIDKMLRDFPDLTRTVFEQIKASAPPGLDRRQMWPVKRDRQLALRLHKAGVIERRQIDEPEENYTCLYWFDADKADPEALRALFGDEG